MFTIVWIFADNFRETGPGETASCLLVFILFFKFMLVLNAHIFE